MLRNMLRPVVFVTLSVGLSNQTQAPTNIAPSNIAPSNIAPHDIAPHDIAPHDIAPHDIAPHADRILVVKSTHTMTLYAGGKELKVYRVWLGRGPGNAKQRQGDNETPEGLYTIVGRNAHSAAYLSLRLSYPNAEDRARARRLHVDPGGDIMIHGLPPGNDWVRPGSSCRIGHSAVSL